MTKPDGGPAFPIDSQTVLEGGNWKGMTLRQWYAGMAMQGLISSNQHTRYDEDAKFAFMWADAMITQEDKC